MRALCILATLSLIACDTGDDPPGGGPALDATGSADAAPSADAEPHDALTDMAQPADMTPIDAHLPDADPPDAAQCDPEQCNGLDDDCDGVIDEDPDGGPLRAPCYPGAPETLGVGVCVGGVSLCQRGALGPCGGAVEPSEETCEGLDNDCDGLVDETCDCTPDEVAACYSGPPQTLGRGLCAGGRQTCEGGVFGACEGEVLPAEQRCDGLDADCDDAVDEGYGVGEACTVGVGACAAQGVRICADGEAVCDAAPGEPVGERCNAIDDDCDGITDEGFDVGAPCRVGVGACAADGARICDGGVAICDAAATDPADETCNAIDDDCDGATDEDFDRAVECVVGLGACARHGLTACDDGGGLSCDVAPGEPTDETCNAIDDDCDGVVDEGFDVGEPCTVGVGACARAGAQVCDADGRATCSAAAGAASDEACNAIDDDCDGITDEGFDLDAACVVGVGACAAEGQVVCDAEGQAECDAVPGEPVAELCNEIDDDCDDAVDEVPECVVPECGNGVVEAGEQCDGGAECANCQWRAFTESERNETTATADDAGRFRVIRGDTSSEGVGCCARPDTDMFRITIDEPSSFGVYCSTGGGCLGFQSPYTCRSMALLDENGAVIATNAASHPEYRCAYVDAERDDALARVEPGTYYIRVTHAYISGVVDPRPSGRYTLDWRLGEPAPAE